MVRFAALALAAFAGLVAGVPSAGAEDTSEVEATSIQEQPLDLATRIRSTPSADQVTVELSLGEFIALQRLDHASRQRLLGLAPSCRTRMTALSTAASPAARLLVLVACSP